MKRMMSQFCGVLSLFRRLAFALAVAAMVSPTFGGVSVLSHPGVISTVWDPVDGASGYYVYCRSPSTVGLGTRINERPISHCFFNLYGGGDWGNAGANNIMSVTAVVDGNEITVGEGLGQILATYDSTGLITPKRSVKGPNIIYAGDSVEYMLADTYPKDTSGQPVNVNNLIVNDELTYGVSGWQIEGAGSEYVSISRNPNNLCAVLKIAPNIPHYYHVTLSVFGGYPVIILLRPVYTVNFDLMGLADHIDGGGSLSQRVREGESAQSPWLNVDPHWLFVGWDQSLDEISENLTIHALYIHLGWDVTFDIGEHGTSSGGGALVQKVAHGSAAVAPEVVAFEEGWRFDGWSCDFSSVKGDLVVSAIYSVVADGMYNHTIDDVTWTFTVSDGIATVGDKTIGFVPAVTKNTPRVLKIPASLGGCPVTSIGCGAFLDCSRLTSVTIPSSVTNIGSSAFSGCSALKSVTIPTSVTSIGERAFSGCSALKSVTIPLGVTSIEYCAFSDCSGLTSVTIPSRVTSVGLGAFAGCSALKSIAIPSSVTSIGMYAFLDCSGLTSVTIPTSVTSIGDFAFSGCSGLTSATIPSSVTSIGMYAFLDCSGLTSATIPSSVTSIGDFAFSGCSGLTSATIPSSVTSIGAYAFLDCSALKMVYVDSGDEDRVRGLLSGSGLDVTALTFATVSAWPDGVTVPAEISGGKEISVADTWVSDYLVKQFGADRATSFAAKFGNDLSKALLMPTGKTAADRTPLCVWQDYVAGTDPTDPESKFTASIKMEDGVMKVMWDPDLNEEGAKFVRTYTTYGVKELGGQWKNMDDVPEAEKSDYKFFKVTVDMP